MAWYHRTFPTDTEGCTLLFVPTPLVPIVAGKIAELLERDEWDSRPDWAAGRAAVLEVLATMACSTEITDRLDRLIAGLGYAAALPTDDPAYNASDTQRAQIDALIAAAQADDADMDDLLQTAIAILAML